jgi:hypothetical protein
MFNSAIDHQRHGRSGASRAVSAAVSAAALCLAALPWQGALAEHGLSAGAGACQVDVYRRVYCDSSNGSGTDGPLSFQASLGTGRASVSLDYGVFKGSADIALYSTASALPRNLNLDSVATGSASDTWLITGGTGIGYMQLTWSVDGTASSFSQSSNGTSGVGTYSDAYFSMDAHISATTFGSVTLPTELSTGAVRESGTYQMPGRAAFNFDRPINVVFFGSVVAMLGTNAQFASASFSGEAHADFSHTARLTGVEIYDASGLLLRDAVISAESGTLYPLAAVPEVPGAAMMLLGIGALAFCRRRSSARRAAVILHSPLAGRLPAGR